MLLQRLNVVRRRKEILLLEEARLTRLMRQKKLPNPNVIRILKKEKELILREEAKIIRALKQAGS